ncbi:hypothetical protein ISO99_04755 [Staphylococcus sp. 18_1_E_LY]|uniref:PhiSLT protein n=1 Tax=Staphylococcus lloydii TaxID=2781774 RepID=A0A7T1AYS6_9STAP|nr:hypothetical protein [Staphylococcus lloydii]MBF7019216.1 hypothetical protein [Staphylococcus lloydii]MBF7026944.1 hypothetical protein [Staphylococcus lloydii]QPM74593.1 hypothetical protein ISP08_09620 [Staphylococcus lloydii]
MTVEIKGIPELEKQLEQRFGKQAMREKSDRALEQASDYMLGELKKNFVAFKDTGASINEMKRTQPFTAAKDRQRTVVIEWVGPMDRYRLIHLNEHGYTRNGKKINPRGFGVIEKTLQASQAKYRSICIRELGRSL